MGLQWRTGKGARRSSTAPLGDDWNAPTALPSLVPTFVPDLAESEARRLHVALCPEIDCVRHLLPLHLIDRAEIQAIRSGTGADSVLIAWGLISEEAYVAALAHSLGIAFEPLFGTPRAACPRPNDELIQAANTGMLPLDDGNGLTIVVVPRLVDSRRLVMLARAGNTLARSIRLTTSARLRAFVMRHSQEAIERRAVNALRNARPELSAGVPGTRRMRLLAYVTLLALAATAAPGVASFTIEIFLGFVFLAWTALRLLGLASERLVRSPPQQSLSDEWLPTYSIIVALYREAAAVPGLVEALRALDYPAEKLDIKFVLEPGDRATLDAIHKLQIGPPFEVLIAPSGGPRTKPKALNAALPFVRGTFVAVFDAEDRLEPDQLRLALETFVAGDERLACVQARLTIDNSADSWLTRLFTAEYAGLFDVFLPGLAALRLPLPLGGSSNHFRTDALRRVGAWDPYNVTEDADLGMRLVRFGYRSAVIPSTTYEEALARFGAWLRQRTRWMKGWVQTWLVHMRSPLRLYRELGAAGFVVFQLLIGGSVLAALVHVPFAISLIWTTAQSDDGSVLRNALVSLGGTALVSGYLISAMLGLIGLARRRLLSCAWALILIPLYWLLLSIAAWRALWQLIRNPYHWEKTEHGLARTSRLGERFRGSA